MTAAREIFDGYSSNFVGLGCNYVRPAFIEHWSWGGGGGGGGFAPECNEKKVALRGIAVAEFTLYKETNMFVFTYGTG